MSEKLYQHNKVEVFKECGLKPRQKDHNTHHIFFRCDLDRHLIPADFPIDDERNLVPLPVKTHAMLHKLVDTIPRFKKDVSTRVYFANMAYNDELDLIPDRMYRSNPKDLMKK